MKKKMKWEPTVQMGAVRITSLNPKLNGIHFFGLPPSSTVKNDKYSYTINFRKCRKLSQFTNLVFTKGASHKFAVFF